MYIIYLNNNEIATINGTDSCYACYEATKTIAEMTGQTASLVWSETGEVVAFFDPNEEEDDCYDEYDDCDECGFDPYCGCYTYDCQQVAQKQSAIFVYYAY